MVYMNPFLDHICFDCIARYAYTVGNKVGQTHRKKLEISARLMEGFSRALLESMDDYVELCRAIYHHTFRVIGEDVDPYAEIKERSMEAAEELMPLAEEYVVAGDQLERAVKVAVAANALDFGTGIYRVSLDEFRSHFREKLEEPFAVNHVQQLRDDLQNSTSVLYVLDNAGECVLDRLLIGLISRRKHVIIAARGGPVLNDATLEEAKRAELDQYGVLITTGLKLPCINLQADADFLNYLREADIVILKGQGNFQSYYLIDKLRDKPTYYLFVPKCQPTARVVGAPVHSLVVLKRK